MVIVRSIVLWIIISTMINAYLMTVPRPVFKRKDYPDEYFINQNTRIDIQNKRECAAFSTAYVLRHFEREADGAALYADFPSKMKSGDVYPKGIRTMLRKKGFPTKYYKGNIHTLKHEVSKGNPVIVFIKVNNVQNYLHFVPVIGYDKTHIYLAESLEPLVNCGDSGQSYNRKVPIDEFKKLWNVKRIYMLFYSYTYIAVDRAA